MDVNIKKLHPEAIIPKYQSKGAAGFDLHSISEIVVFPGETVIVKTGLAFAIPEGYELQVRPRSGMSFKTKIRVANSPGTVDSDYRGDVGIIIDNIGSDEFKVRMHDRIAQGVICPVNQVSFKEVKDLNETERGDQGYGSSGR